MSNHWVWLRMLTPMVGSYLEFLGNLAILLDERDECSDIGSLLLGDFVELFLLHMESRA